MSRPTLVKPVVGRIVRHYLKPLKDIMRGLRVHVSGSVETMGGKAAVKVGIMG